MDAFFGISGRYPSEFRRMPEAVAAENEKNNRKLINMTFLYMSIPFPIGLCSFHNFPNNINIFYTAIITTSRHFGQQEINTGFLNPYTLRYLFRKKLISL